MKLFYTILLCALFAPARAQSLLRNLAPHHVQVQYAGNIGLVSAGVGYNLAKDKVHITVMDGFVPASIAGSNINTIALKSTFDIATLKLPGNKHLEPYIGLATLFETSGNGVYTRLPERYTDRRYYRFSAFHLAAFAGGKLALPFGSRQGQKLELYAETGTIDSYAYYYFKNNAALNFTDIFSMALGVTYHLGAR